MTRPTPALDATASLRRQPVSLPASERPRLFVVVDTEEEFDWDRPFSRANTSVTAMKCVGRLQEILARYRITPTYVVDFPVASQADGYAPLKEFVDEGDARIGAHLHPWVNPPFDEEVTRRNSYGCRLGATLETEKIRVLQHEIGEAFGRLPRVYKAGRYGFGPTTASALETLGFDLDASVNPRMDFTMDGGPSFDGYDTTPFFFGEHRRLLEVPCSTDFTGVAGSLSPRLHSLAARPLLAPVRLVGIMARLGIANKVMLSPEGSTIDEMKALTAALLRKGVRTFSFTLHSPSLDAGFTPYVRTSADLRAFLDTIAAYCEFFVGELGGVPSTPEDFFDSLSGTAAPRADRSQPRQEHRA